MALKWTLVKDGLPPESMDCFVYVYRPESDEVFRHGWLYAMCRYDTESGFDSQSRVYAWIRCPEKMPSRGWHRFLLPDAREPVFLVRTAVVDDDSVEDFVCDLGCLLEIKCNTRVWWCAYSSSQPTAVIKWAKIPEVPADLEVSDHD